MCERFLPVYAMNQYKGGEGRLHTFLTSVINFTLWPLYPMERTTVPIEQKAGWVPEQI